MVISKMVNWLRLKKRIWNNTFPENVLLITTIVAFLLLGIAFGLQAGMVMFGP